MESINCEFTNDTHKIKSHKVKISLLTMISIVKNKGILLKGYTFLFVRYFRCYG